MMSSIQTPIIIAIEGNIGCGKSTLLQYLSEQFESLCTVLSEPINEWQNCKGTNLLVSNCL